MIGNCYTSIPRLALCALAVAWVLWLAAGVGAWAYNSGALTCDRALSASTATVGSSITVTCVVANGESEPARGFYLSEHLPDGLSMALMEATIDGVAVEGVRLHVGVVGEVYEGLRTWRIVVETPEDIDAGNPIPPGQTLRLRYGLTSATAGAYTLRHSNWVGVLEESGAPVFGYREADGARTVTFESPPAPAGYLLLH